jgi:hypothetical protein
MYFSLFVVSIKLLYFKFTISCECIRYHLSTSLSKFDNKLKTFILNLQLDEYFIKLNRLVTEFMVDPRSANIETCLLVLIMIVSYCLNWLFFY